jgi:hypothetical protein
LHEAGHNFGPHSDYRINEKTAKEIFGGAHASMLEELKAQTLNLWYLSFLLRKKVINEDQRKESYTRAILWAFSHAARGMTTTAGHPQPYSQLAAIQIGHLIENGALGYADGRFQIQFDRLEPAVDQLMTMVGGIKARGDVAGAKALLQKYTSEEGLKRMHLERIAQEMLRYPKAAFRYAVLL